MNLLELVFVRVAEINNRLHIDLVKRSQNGGCRLALHEALGDAHAQTRHGDALLGAIA